MMVQMKAAVKEMEYAANNNTQRIREYECDSNKFIPIKCDLFISRLYVNKTEYPFSPKMPAITIKV